MIEDAGKKAGVRILIAEDELIVAEDLAMTLQDLGYQIAGMATTGELAIQLAQESKPALVLMDIKLAGEIDGIQASEQIRVRFDIPVIFLTAYEEKDILSRAKHTEPYGYLAKPFSHHILKITLETALYKHAGDKRVRESEAKYRLISENANIGVFTTSLDGTFLQANPAVATMAGYDTVEEFLALRAEDLYSNESDRRRFVNELLEKGSVKDYEIPARKKDGTPQWVSLNAVLQKDHVGNPVSILGIVEDITDRKMAEKALRESEERYRLLFDNMLDGFAYCKMLFENGRPQDFVYLHVNDAFERLTDLKNVTGRKVTEVIPGIRESNPELFEIYGKVALGGNPEKFETYIDSLGIWFSISVYSTEREHFIAVFENITDRQSAEEALQESEKNYRELVQNANSAIIRWKSDGAVTFFNEHAQAIFGYKSGEILGKDVRILVPERESTGAGLNTLVQDIVKYPERYLNYVNENICRDGRRVWMTWTNKPILDEDGQVSEILAVGSDVTALRESEERYRQAYEKTPVMMQSIDRNARLVSVSDHWLDVLGYERSEVIGRNPAEFQTPESRSYALKVAIPHFLKTGISKDEPLQFVKKNGEVIDILLTATAERDNKGEIVRSRAVLIDVTERKRAEQALRDSEERYRTVADFTYDWEYWIGTDDKLLYVSPSCERITGYSAQEFLDDPALMERIIHPDDLVKMVNHFHEARKVHHGSSYSQDFRIIHRDGATRWISHVCRPVHGKAGQLLGRRASNRDITDRKRAEFAQNRLAIAVEQAAEAIVITDTAGEIQYVNPAFERVTGYTREEAIGQNPRLLKSGEHDSMFYEDLWETIRRGDVWTGRFINKRKDGKLYQEDATISPVRHSEGKIVNFVAVKRDITEHLALSRQLLQAQKMEAIGTLAGGIAHDFNNILQVALGYSELLLTGKSGKDPDHDDLQKIHQAARSGADLVRNLLTFSRKVEPKPVPMDLNNQVRNVEKLLHRTIPRMINIRLELTAAVKRINADPGQIEQIIMNLSVNARDAMGEKGSLTIRTEDVILDEEYCRMNAEAQPGAHVMLSVSDTGHGMDRETLQHIFEPFYTTKELGRGTGLGLAMVYGIVKQHNGHLTCYSEVGRGSTFRVYLPAILSEPEDVADSVGDMPAFGTETVLLVDDEDSVRRLGERILTKSGYTVLIAANGEDALALYNEKREQISLVLLDLIMPSMGGKDCLNELLKIDPAVKVLIASGYAADDTTKECVKLGAKGFVAKPYRFKDLLQQVRKALDER